MKFMFASTLFLLVVTALSAEFFISIDIQTVGDEKALEEVVEIIEREVGSIHDVTLLEDSEQASIILRFHIAEVATRGEVFYGSVIHMSVLIPFQSANAGRQLLYIADDMGGAPPEEYGILIRDMIKDFDELLSSSR